VKITLVRHAEVIEEYQGKYNGHIDIPLSKNGKKQAQKLAQKLKNENFDRIYCSDLIRAKQTLDAFDLDIEPVYTDRLREKSWGKHEGKSFEEIQSEGIEYKSFEQWINELDGEDIESYCNNAKEYFFNTISKSDSRNILVITHAGFIKTILAIVKNIPLEDAFKINISYTNYVVLNGKSMNIFEL